MHRENLPKQSVGAARLTTWHYSDTVLVFWLRQPAGCVHHCITSCSEPLDHDCLCSLGCLLPAWKFNNSSVFIALFTSKTVRRATECHFM